jgi:hypothetical protein
MRPLNYFENVEVTMLCDVTVSDEFSPLNEEDEELFEFSGIRGIGDRGGWEECILKAGSRAYVSMTPNGQFYLTDSKNSHTCHAEITISDFKVMEQVTFPEVLKPVPGHLGLFK